MNLKEQLLEIIEDSINKKQDYDKTNFKFTELYHNSGLTKEEFLLAAGKIISKFIRENKNGIL